MNTLTEQLNETKDLDEKLRLIDELLAKQNLITPNSRELKAPVDPMAALICQGCQ